MATHKLLLLPGDGIGPEVMREVEKIVGWFRRRGVGFETETDLVGGAAFDAHGAALHCRAPGGVHSLRAWPEDLCEARVEGLRATADTQPIARWYRTILSPAPYTAGRVPRAIADERCVAAWVELSRPYGVTQQLCLPLHVAADEHRIFVAGRPDRDDTKVNCEL